MVSAAAAPAAEPTGGTPESPAPGVRVLPGGLARAGRLAAAAAPAHRWVLVTDTTVAALHLGPVLDGLAAVRDAGAPEPLVLAIPPGEAEKTRGRWATLTDAMLDAGCGRDTTVLALGGGVVGDLAGFVAATYMRGVPLVQLPTTLLAMVDASVGGKTAVDVPAGKNLVGAFHPAALVLADPHALRTLPVRQLRAGVAEMLKHGLLADAAHLDAVAAAAAPLAALPPDAPAPAEVADRLGALVAASIAIKAAVVAADPTERGRRRTLNLGHTLAHAIELITGYAVLHGEAVAIGLVLECELAERLGVAASGTAARARAAVRAVGLPDRLPPGLDPAALVAATRLDKKAQGGRVAYALPTGVGAMAEAEGRWAVPVDDADVRRVLERA